MLSKKFSHEMVGAFLLLLIALGAAYGGSTPSQVGHSSDEIQLRFRTYVSDCTGGSADGSCAATCALPREKAVSGNCISELGYAFAGYGVTDASGNQVTWDCSDKSHAAGYFLQAEVICLQTGGP